MPRRPSLVSPALAPAPSATPEQSDVDQASEEGSARGQASGQWRSGSMMLLTRNSRSLWLGVGPRCRLPVRRCSMPPDAGSGHAPPELNVRMQTIPRANSFARVTAKSLRFMAGQHCVVRFVAAARCCGPGPSLDGLSFLSHTAIPRRSLFKAATQMRLSARRWWSRAASARARSQPLISVILGGECRTNRDFQRIRCCPTTFQTRRFSTRW